ncbi:MAG TPA: hypothetical protein VJK54_03665 [Chthoniobacterales bacterium]|nr:hypothetical protein [Chthoniobacterales bacterium]
MKINVNIFLILLSLVFAGSSSLFAQMDPAIVEGVEGILGIEEFRQALNDHPVEGRLVVHREEDVVAIQPQEADLNITRAVAHGENREAFERVDAQTAIKQKMSSNRDPALIIYCKKWLLDAGVEKTGESVYAKQVLENGADVQLVETFKGYCLEIIAALDSKILLALNLIQAAENIQQDIETFSNQLLNTYWKNIARIMPQVVLNKSPEIVGLYKEIVAQYQVARTSYQEGNRISDISQIEHIPYIYSNFEHKYRKFELLGKGRGDIFISSAARLIIAAKAFMKANESAIWENRRVVTFWNRMDQSYKHLAIWSMPEKMCLSDADPLYYIRRYLYLAEKIFNKAIQAMDENHADIAICWQKIGREYQRLSDWVGVNKWVDKTEEKFQPGLFKPSFAGKGDSYLFFASQAVKNIVHSMNNNHSKLEELWQKITEQYRKVARCYRKAATANDQEYEEWYCVANAIGKSIDQLSSAVFVLKKSTQKERDLNQDLADPWHEMVQQYKKAGEYYEKASLAVLDKEITEYNRCLHIGNLMSSYAEQLLLATDALKRSTEFSVQNYSELAALWEQQALQHRKLADYFKGIIEENALEKMPCPQGAILAKSSDSQLCNAKVALVKADKAIQEEDQILPKFWRKIVRQYQETAKCYLKVAECYFNAAESYEQGDEVEGDLLSQQAISAQEEADVAAQLAAQLVVQEANEMGETLQNP